MLNYCLLHAYIVGMASVLSDLFSCTPDPINRGGMPSHTLKHGIINSYMQHGYQLPNVSMMIMNFPFLSVSKREFRHHRQKKWSHSNRQYSTIWPKVWLALLNILWHIIFWYEKASQNTSHENKRNSISYTSNVLRQ